MLISGCVHDSQSYCTYKRLCTFAKRKAYSTYSAQLSTIPFISNYSNPNLQTQMLRNAA